MAEAKKESAAVATRPLRPVFNPRIRYTVVRPDGFRLRKHGRVGGYVGTGAGGKDNDNNIVDFLIPTLLHAAKAPVRSRIEDLRVVDERGNDLPVQPEVFAAARRAEVERAKAAGATNGRVGAAHVAKMPIRAYLERFIETHGEGAPHPGVKPWEPGEPPPDGEQWEPPEDTGMSVPPGDITSDDQPGGEVDPPAPRKRK